MSLAMPYSGQKQQLMRGMADSFSIRRKWIKDKGPTVTEILEKYPHLMSYCGEMVC